MKKILATHLPAFHQIPENDEWWGKGFTEWDNVKSGKKLYKGHYQPIKPYKENYYDLSNKDDIRKQIELAKKYHIHGFVFYHYWFGNGKKLFEKPAETILNDNGLDINFCFCWANQTWLTTWHGMEPRTLLEQKYPGKSDWEMHYRYLKNFFQDKRYIKVNNRPMLFVYNPSEIPDYDEMVDFFEEKCINDNFDGIYIVEYIFPRNRNLYSKKSSAVYEFEPRYSLFFDVSKFNLVKRAIVKKLKLTDYQSYDKLWKFIINRKRTYSGKTIISGCFSGWDNSARNGRNSIVVKGKTVEKFYKYFNLFYTSKRKDISDEYCVINAWNEWSEGAYLEPDSVDQFGYLESIRDIVELNKD